MNDMEEKILIVNSLVFADKKTGEVKTRLDFIFVDPEKFTMNKSFKGYPKGSCFYSGNLLEKFPNELFMNSVLGTLVSKPNTYDPMKSSLVLKSLKYKDRVFSLL